MKETELVVGAKVRWRGGLFYLADWFLAAGGKVIGILTPKSSPVAVGNNVPIEDVELVRE